MVCVRVTGTQNVSAKETKVSEMKRGSQEKSTCTGPGTAVRPLVPPGAAAVWGLLFVWFFTYQLLSEEGLKVHNESHCLFFKSLLFTNLFFFFIWKLWPLSITLTVALSKNSY